MTMHIGEPPVDAIVPVRQPRVIDAKQMKTVACTS